MGLLELLLLFVIAAICGGIGQAIAGTRGGCLASVALGFIGALLGAWLSRTMGLPELLTVKVDQVEFPIVWSIIGAALFVALLSWMTRRPAEKRRGPRP